MNMGHICQMVRATLDQPQRVFLANRVDGVLITPTDIRDMLRMIQGGGI